MRLSHALGAIATAIATCVVAPSCSSSDGAESGPDAAIEATPCDPAIAKCEAGGACVKDSDCANLNCANGVCSAASCDDKKQDQGEQGVDCGGPCKACDGAPCTAGTECKSDACAAGMCGPSAGKTCGVGLPNACELTEACGQDKDCKSIVCTGGKCVAVTPDVHTDGRVNGGETDVDCGGTTGAPVCKEGKICLKGGDCEGLCTAGKCAAPSRTDGKISPSLGETDVDCGGTMPDKNGVVAKVCATGKLCGSGIDCESRFCGVDKKCEPRKTGRKDGDESDVDCGGTADPDTMVASPRCADDLGCEGDGDCSSKFCNISLKKCVAGRSCKAAVGNATSGVVTCGKRETGDGTKVHESCCRSLPLPVTTTVKLDKYEVTSGRMRQFVETVGPNIRKWVNDEIIAATPTGDRLAADIPVALRALLPASKTPGDPMNLVMQLGATVMDSRTPSMSQGCFQDGTSDTAGAYGANTYYWDHATLKQHISAAIAPRRYTQAQYDEKSLNCGAYWMYAAFCAWDGGRMPTQAEVDEAWGATAYPWGTSTFTFPLDSAHQGPYQYEATANYANSLPGGPVLLFYHFPGYGNAYDMSGYIAAPGRFILDKTANTSANGESWMDLGANVMELTSNLAPSGSYFCDFSITNAPGDVPDLSKCNDGGVAGVPRASNIPVTNWVGGSWEGHRVFNVTPAAEPFFTRTSYKLLASTQYGKTGVRCAR